MNLNMAQSLVSDHIRESRQQAAAARRASVARSEDRKSSVVRKGSVVRKASHRASRRDHRVVREV